MWTTVRLDCPFASMPNRGTRPPPFAESRRDCFAIVPGHLRAQSFALPGLVPDLVPKYLVTVGTRWYLLGLAAALEYQRVPSSPNSHKHYRDSNSLGGTNRSAACPL